MKTDELGLPIQISGGYWGDSASGIEVGFNFFKSESALFSSAQFIIGHSKVSGTNNYVDEWNYVGVSATYTYGGFYIEPGISIGSGDYSNPQLMLQLGWLWDM